MIYRPLAAFLLLWLASPLWAAQGEVPPSSPIVNGWSVVVDDSFDRADTTPPEAIGNGWADVSKSWKILNHTLVPTVSGTACGGRGANGPIRPKTEYALNHGAELTTGPLASSDSITNIPYTLLLRVVPGTAWGSCYAFQLKLNPKAQTAMVTVGPASQYGTFNATKGATFPVLSGHSYILTATARSLSLGGFSILSYTVADASAPGTILDSGESASAAMKSAFCSNAGTIGIQQERSDVTRSDLDVITRFRSFVKQPISLSRVASPLTISTTGDLVTLSGSGTAWTSNTVFTLSNLPGCTITSQEVLSPTLARITLSTGTATGTLRLSEASSGEACDLEVGLTVAPLIVANLLPKPDTATTVKILGGVVTGGKPPYTYRWHRSLNWSFVPDESTSVANATHLDLLDTPPDAQCYAYKLVVTDRSPGAALSGTSPSAPGMRNYTTAPNPIFKPTSSKIPALKIGWIGDSITASTTIPANTIAYLKTAGLVVDSSTNCGVPGSQSSSNGKGWRPDAAASAPDQLNYYAKAVTAFKADNVNLIMLMLGTNEANGGLGYMSNYKDNLHTILAQLAKDLPGIPVVLNTPALATLANGGRDANEAHIAFVHALDELLADHPNAVRGDRNMPVWSYGRYHEYSDDIHPNSAGRESYARFWADALLRYEESAHQ